jgi:hypothetical protein
MSKMRSIALQVKALMHSRLSFTRHVLSLVSVAKGALGYAFEIQRLGVGEG